MPIDGHPIEPLQLIRAELVTMFEWGDVVDGEGEFGRGGTRLGLTRVVGGDL